jgi:hypothetical protein
MIVAMVVMPPVSATVAMIVMAVSGAMTVCGYDFGGGGRSLGAGGMFIHRKDDSERTYKYTFFEVRAKLSPVF